MENEKTQYTIAEDFVLPSKGQIYETTFDPRVRLRSMTIRDELKRSNAQNTTIHRTLCEIIDSCLLDKLPLSVYDMCIGDYEYLLHKLRIVTYGPDYKMVVGCPHCTAVYEATTNLDDLKVKDFDLSEYQKALDIVLPTSKKKVKLKIETPRILDSVEFKVREFKKKQPDANYDARTLYLLQELIETVDGVKLSFIELENFVNHLSARDANYIENKIEKANRLIGLDTSLDLTCKTCGGDIKTYFRLGSEFFRPTNDE